MREIEAIISQYTSLKSQRIDAVLATVVHVEGSSYRRAGARMLVDEFGNITGAISGGCLEGDALRKALHALHQQRNKLVTYDTSDEDDAIIGAQLGCNGIIRVLFEPLDYEDQYNACELLKSLTASREHKTILIRFNLNRLKDQEGTCLIISGNLDCYGKKPAGKLLNLVLKQSEKCMNAGKSGFLEFEEYGNLFIQYYQPPVNLVIVGAGNDAQVLSGQAELLGWEVTVTDGRPTHANEKRFSGSCQVIVSEPEKTLENISIDTRTCFVLMSHNYNYDLAVLKLLWDKEIPYIGILGPQKKYDRMLKEFEEEGIQISNETRKKIHAPVGLELGAETPAEIGLSILAEIQAVLTGKSARPLKEKAAPIHEKKDNRFKKVEISN